MVTKAKTAGWPPCRKSLKLNGGAEGGRTPDLRIANAALCQTELLPHTRERSLGSTVEGVKFDVFNESKNRSSKAAEPISTLCAPVSFCSRCEVTEY